MTLNQLSLVLWGIAAIGLFQVICVGEDSTRPEADPTVFVDQFEFKDNTVFNDAELLKILPKKSGSFTITDLEAARQALSRHYVSEGYINSGAILPKQRVTNGIVRFDIVEGCVSEINVQGNQRLNAGYLKRRINRSSGHRLQMSKLRETLERLQRDSSIAALQANLEPAMANGRPIPGKSWLDVKVREVSPFDLSARFHNQRPPSVGAEEVQLIGTYRNLIGLSDALNLRYGVARRSNSGVAFSRLDRLSASYAVPLSVSDTTLELVYRRNDFAVIEEQFEGLGILSESEQFRASVRQPLLRTRRSKQGRRSERDQWSELGITLSGEATRVMSFLNGEPFSFSRGAVGGESNLSVIRLATDWTLRSQVQVLTTQISANLGLDALDATMGPTNRDAEFFSLSGQTQWIRRWGIAEIWSRVGYQWTADPLLSPERFSLGGMATVRGYRENRLVRDHAVLSSVEVRLPVWTHPRRPHHGLKVAPFADFGAGWNEDQSSENPQSIASAGVGLIFEPHDRINSRLYWGYPFRKASDEGDLQDYGLHFELNLKIF